MGLMEGKVAIVTGAARGIGRAEALLLASEGARVVVNDVGGTRDGSGSDSAPAGGVVDEIRAAGGEAVANADDIATWEGGHSVVEQALGTWGQVDALVNNAGILRDRMSFNMEEEDWDAVIRVHLKGHFVVTRHLIAYWRGKAKAGEPARGRIVNTSSESGLYGNAGQANYAAAKAGIASLTVVLARELARYNVTVNAIAPRARTRLTEDLLGESIAPKPDQFDAWSPEAVAPLTVWLASDSASHVSGQVFVVGGGTLALMKGWDADGVAPMQSTWTPAEAGTQADALFTTAGRPADINGTPFDLDLS